jgi:uncharacterized membrane protein YeaQ/YmgE (transglycosylase-associated protein family)
MSKESILVILLVGLIAGWLAGHLVRGTGYGLIADICIGIIGALIGSWLLPQFGIHLGAGIVSSIIVATIGAVILRSSCGWTTRGGIYVVALGRRNRSLTFSFPAARRIS